MWAAAALTGAEGEDARHAWVEPEPSPQQGAGGCPFGFGRALISKSRASHV